MKSNSIQSFPPEVIDQLKYYVYRLIDPRNGNTFYVGKGKSNRLFQHLKNASKITDQDAEDLKTKTINDIRLVGLDPIHIIHRHGLSSSKEALQIEAALLDAYPEAQNIQGGHGSDDFGAMHVEEIMQKHQAETAQFEHKLLLITVNKTLESRNLYDATRLAWRIRKDRAEKAEYVLAVVKGIIRGVYRPITWEVATIENFPHRIVDSPNRIGFDGIEAPEEIKKQYINKRIPEDYRKPGAAFPVKYVNI